MELCLSADGHVTSVKVAGSSGYTRLDDAAVQWIKRQRYAPAMAGDKAIAVCGQKLSYEWRYQPPLGNQYPKMAMMKLERKARLRTDGPPLEYPPESLAAREEGKVALTFCVGPEGKPESFGMSKSSGHDRLDVAFFNWAVKRQFEPAIKDGAPVGACDVRVEHVWKLPKN